eukprot:GHVH01002423.1.p1 GENE.GHVH01002423.1~~GHVH01002423.1.p1  ORF type:complete len:474 (+),score=41.96 GHVH01002423.1:32-1423(+)
MSVFGNIIKFTTFGESHGKSVGVVVEGIPSKLHLTEDDIQPFLNRRRPGQCRINTDRNEMDMCSILSGVCNVTKMTLGTPICVIVNNKDQRTFDYADVDAAPRPGHAEYTYQMKYGIRAKSGGGRASARETIGRCIAGAICHKALKTTFGLTEFSINSFVSEVGSCRLPESIKTDLVHNYSLPESSIHNCGTLGCMFDETDGSLSLAYGHAGDATFMLKPLSTEIDGSSPVSFSCEQIAHMVDLPGELVYMRCPHLPTAASMVDLISKSRLRKDSIGGVTTTVITGLPAGLGEPVFNKFEALLAFGMLSLPATKGFSIGQGFEASRSFSGTTHNDLFTKGSTTPSAVGNTSLQTKTNNAGGTLGGITSGAPVYFDVAFKPVSSIGVDQDTVDWSGNDTKLVVEGRHDPCVLPRCPPLVDAMALMVCADAVAMQRARGDQSWTPIGSYAPDVADRIKLNELLTK